MWYSEYLSWLLRLTILAEVLFGFSLDVFRVDWSDLDLYKKKAEKIGFIEGQIVVFKYTALMLVLVNGHFIQFNSTSNYISSPPRYKWVCGHLHGRPQ